MNVPIKTTNVNFNQGIDFTHHRVPFKALSNSLRSTAGEVGANSNNKTNTLAHWDDVKPIDPEGFATLTGVNKNFVEAYLNDERRKIFMSICIEYILYMYISAVILLIFC